MLRQARAKRIWLFVSVLFGVLALALVPTTVPNAAADFTGREILSVTRIAHGGADYASVQNVTVRASGFVNAAAFGGLAANPLGAAAEIKLHITDYQDKQLRRRLDVAPIASMGNGPTFLVFTGSQGGGMMFGNEFRVRETAVSRHWAMMGFDTLNRAIEGELVTARQSDEGPDYVVEVKFNSDDTVRYWINKSTFLIDKITTRYRSQPLIEEQRSEYHRADCMMLPYHIITRLQGQPFADLAIETYDLKTMVPATRFVIQALP